MLSSFLTLSQPNKLKTREEHKIIWFILQSDPSLSRDNSCVVEVIVDDLIMGLGPSFYTAKTFLLLFHEMNTGFLHGKIIFLPSYLITFLKTLGKGRDT